MEVYCESTRKYMKIYVSVCLCASKNVCVHVKCEYEHVSVWLRHRWGERDSQPTLVQGQPPNQKIPQVKILADTKWVQILWQALFWVFAKVPHDCQLGKTSRSEWKKHKTITIDPFDLNLILDQHQTQEVFTKIQILQNGCWEWILFQDIIR